MNVLFMTMSNIRNLEQHNIYTDLMKCFVANGHNVVIVSPAEKRYGLESSLEANDNISILHVKIGNLQKCGMVEKGLSMMTISHCFKKTINTFLPSFKADLILYSTPPITLCSVVKYLKNKYSAKTYLMLKDIFPQNAVDIGIMKTTGIKGILYKYFRRLESELYKVSDYIGCMSNANVEYLLEHNSSITPQKVNICPNSIIVDDFKISFDERIRIREKYNIPKDKMVFVYGGNLGKPQDVSYIISCIECSKTCDNIFFLIVGSGTEYNKVADYYNTHNNKNLLVLNQIPRDEYDLLTAACDIGLVFLDHRFTIPNYPSRILSYMQAGIPIIACTDRNTDVGKTIVDGGFGWWCESNSPDSFVSIINEIKNADLKQMGHQGYKYLLEHFTVEESYNSIIGAII